MRLRLHLGLAVVFAVLVLAVAGWQGSRYVVNLRYQRALRQAVDRWDKTKSSQLEHRVLDRLRPFPRLGTSDWAEIPRVDLEDIPTSGGVVAWELDGDLLSPVDLPGLELPGPQRPHDDPLKRSFTVLLIMGRAQRKVGDYYPKTPVDPGNPAAQNAENLSILSGQRSAYVETAYVCAFRWPSTIPIAKCVVEHRPPREATQSTSEYGTHLDQGDVVDELRRLLGCD